MIKHLVPPRIRSSARVTLRWLKDIRNGNLTRLVKGSEARFSQGIKLNPWIKITQPIYLTAYSENKKHNISLAISKLNNLAINSDELFSFWHIVKQPNVMRGYLLGRSLINHQLQAEYGGGLCQLAGLIYHIALTAGLTIIERHQHSVDLYTQEARYSPLGADAAVVYGYKDLRLVNNFNQPICFRFDLQEDCLTGSLCAGQAITECEVKFLITEIGEQLEVETIRYDKSQNVENLGKCLYKRL